MMEYPRRMRFFVPFLFTLLTVLYVESQLLEGVCLLPVGIGQWNSKVQTL
jgi:hypothetical protein